jgi:hypothetical protein
MTTTNTEHPGFTYDTCAECGQDVLAFTLVGGECPECRAK